MKKQGWILLSFITLLSPSCKLTENSFVSASNPSSSVNEMISLEIASLPHKTTYYEGERFNRSGLKLKATFSDGSIYTPRNDEVTVLNQESLNLDCKEVVASFRNWSVKIPITVKPLELDYLKILSYPYTTTYVMGGNYAFLGLRVLGKVKQGDEREINVEDCSLSIEGTTIKDREVISLTSGHYEVAVSFCAMETSFPIQIVEGYKIEAENIEFSTPYDRTNYVRVKNSARESYITQSNGEGKIRPISDESALLASGESYLGDINKGNIIDFYFYSESEKKAEISLRASSCYLTAGEDWNPKEMSDEKLNELFFAKINEEEIVIDDDVILPGKGSKDGEVDFSLWVNWNVVNFGTITTLKGYNCISLEVTSQYVNYLGYGCSFNLDYLSINFIS